MNKQIELRAWAVNDRVPADLQKLCKQVAELIEQLQAEKGMADMGFAVRYLEDFIKEIDDTLEKLNRKAENIILYEKRKKELGINDTPDTE